MDDNEHKPPHVPEPVPEFLAAEDDLSKTDIVPETAENPFMLEENMINKGDFLDIRKKIPQLKDIAVGVGWDHKMFEENPLDVDLSCFLLNKNDQTREDQDFVFYNNDKACEGAVRYMGDSRTGAGDGDDETIMIDLNGLPFDIMKIAFTITIYNAPEREQSFAQVRSLYFRIVNANDDNEIFRYRLSEEEFSGAVGIKVGELIREGPKWYFSALGEPIPGGLGAIATQYGCIIILS